MIEMDGFWSNFGDVIARCSHELELPVSIYIIKHFCSSYTVQQSNNKHSYIARFCNRVQLKLCMSVVYMQCIDRAFGFQHVAYIHTHMQNWNLL